MVNWLDTVSELLELLELLPLVRTAVFEQASLEFRRNSGGALAAPYPTYSSSYTKRAAQASTNFASAAPE
jgi:hypothetical protein